MAVFVSRKEELELSPAATQGFSPSSLPARVSWLISRSWELWVCCRNRCTTHWSLSECEGFKNTFKCFFLQRLKIRLLVSLTPGTPFTPSSYLSDKTGTESVQLSIQTRAITVQPLLKRLLNQTIKAAGVWTIHRLEGSRVSQRCLTDGQTFNSLLSLGCTASKDGWREKHQRQLGGLQIEDQLLPPHSSAGNEISDLCSFTCSAAKVHHQL